jgi:hypothetical protein
MQSAAAAETTSAEATIHRTTVGDTRDAVLVPCVVFMSTPWFASGAFARPSIRA